jgi:iron complex outermembrane receptor protein
LLYGSAYRAPNVFELYYRSNDAMPNPDLQPEDIQTWELVWEQDLARGLRLTLSGYYYHLEDMICLTDTPPYTFYNTGKACGGGGEVEVEWRTEWGFRARTSYCLQRVEDEETGDSLPNSPLHMAKAQFLLPLWSDKLFTGMELQYLGEVKTLPGRGTTRAGDYCIANWTVFSQRIVKGLEISASVYNLFDTDYAHPAGTGHIQDLIWQDGRSFRIKATYRF